MKSGFSPVHIFCYRYLPQMVIVLYGIAWAAVDLDVKRLEPYFQLSNPGGASASDSILLRYPFDFLALVPIIAAKRRFVIPVLRVGMCADRAQTLERFCIGNGIGFDLLGDHAITELPSDRKTGGPRNPYAIFIHKSICELQQSSGLLGHLIPLFFLRSDLAGRENAGFYEPGCRCYAIQHTKQVLQPVY